MSIWRELKARIREENQATGGIGRRTIPGRKRFIAIIVN
jgi:hypothetical protein